MMTFVHFTGDASASPLLTLKRVPIKLRQIPFVPSFLYLLMTPPSLFPPFPFLVVVIQGVQNLLLRKRDRFSSGLSQSAGPAF